MERWLFLDAVGLTPALLHSGAMPGLQGWAVQRELRTLVPDLPAVTCTVQASMLTGQPPSRHGAVANGWYFRELAEVWLWRQSVHLIDGGGTLPTVFSRWRETYPDSPCAQLFWWWNLPSHAQLSATPRPTYFADGRKGPDIHTHPPALREDLQQKLGDFPLFRFWGPAAGLPATRWIADATLRTLETQRPGLATAYLPHLDYDLQRFGPDGPEARAAASELDGVLTPLIAAAEGLGYQVVVLSEYGIEEVDGAVEPNRALRRAGLLAVHAARNGSLLDPGNSRAFAVCDHQLAHVYVADPADRPQVRALLEGLDGVAEVHDRASAAALGLDHPRSGEFVCLAAPRRWFAYPYWLEDEAEPDFARTVDIHRKPGYDPCELFLDPARGAWKARIAGKLLRKALGFRTVMDVVPLDTSLVRGSHGRAPSTPEQGPLWIGPPGLLPGAGPVTCRDALWGALPLRRP